MRQAGPKLPDVGCSGAVLGLKRDKNVGIGCADRARSVIDHIDLAIGEADIVDDGVHFLGRYSPPDGILHQITKSRRFLYTGSGFRAEVKNELTVVARRKEVLTQPWHQQRGGEADG